jgi:uncharacterized damage-inducible protein DinB
MNDKNFRKNLVEFLRGGLAHVSPEKALDDINPEIRNFRGTPNIHSIYEELEHMRIAQEDILKYTLNEGWESPEWPDGYWPDDNDSMNDDTWNNTFNRFFIDLQSMIDLVNDEVLDLTEEIPHGNGRTYLREILLVANHNAYHIGKIVDIRKILGDW